MNERGRQQSRLDLINLEQEHVELCKAKEKLSQTLQKLEAGLEKCGDAQSNTKTELMNDIVKVKEELSAMEKGLKQNMLLITDEQAFLRAWNQEDIRAGVMEDH